MPPVQPARIGLLGRFIRSSAFQNYGMVFILILLGAAVSVATWKPWDFHAGKKGGRLAAQAVAGQGVSGPVYLLAIAPADAERDYTSAFAAFRSAVAEAHTPVQVEKQQVFTDMADAPRQLRLLLNQAVTAEATPAALVCFTQSSAQRAREILPQLASALRRPGLARLPTISPPMKSRSIFLSYDNIMTVIRQSALTAIMAVGMTMVIITGGIDLSVGSLLALIGVICALVLKMDYGVPWWGLALLFWVLFTFLGGRARRVAALPALPRRAMIVALALAVGLACLPFTRHHILGITKHGRTTAQALVQQIGQTGKIALLVDSSRRDNVRMVEELEAELKHYPGIAIVERVEIPASGWWWPWERSPKFQRAADAVGRLVEQHGDLAAIIPVDIGSYDGAAKKLTESLVETKVVWPGMSATGLILFALCMSVFCGAITGAGTGVLATRFSIPPFIATLAIMLMARSLAISMTRSEAISNLPHDFNAWHNGFILESRVGQWLPVPVLFLALIYLAGYIVMSRTRFGRYVYAIGGNEEATRLSGVRTGKIKIWVYLINGALAGFVAALTVAKLAAGDPKTGVLKELDVIASVVVGGTSLSGGEGKVLGTLIGAVLIGVVRNALNLLGFPDTLQDFAIGAAILGAVLLDVAKKRL